MKHRGIAALVMAAALSVPAASADAALKLPAPLVQSARMASVLHTVNQAVTTVVPALGANAVCQGGQDVGPPDRGPIDEAQCGLSGGGLDVLCWSNSSKADGFSIENDEDAECWVSAGSSPEVALGCDATDVPGHQDSWGCGGLLGSSSIGVSEVHDQTGHGVLHTFLVRLGVARYTCRSNTASFAVPDDCTLSQ